MASLTEGKLRYALAHLAALRCAADRGRLRPEIFDAWHADHRLPQPGGAHEIL